jgi:hypothetical protein
VRAVKHHVNGGGGGGRVARLRHDERMQLHDLALERSILGACLTYPDLIFSSDVSSSDFYSGANEAIFTALLQLVADGEPVDTGRLRGLFHDRGQLAAVGGDDYLMSLTDGIPTRDVDTKRLRRLARKRRVAEAAAAVSAYAGTDDLPRALALLDIARHELETVDGPRSPIPFRSTSELFAPLDASTWIVPGLHLGPGRPALWAGYGSSAKTLSVQALALAVASGTPAWGHFETIAGVVRHLDYEQGFRATARRYQRLGFGHGIDVARLGNRLQVAVFPNIFLDSLGAVDVYARACEGASLVILDALRGATPTQDENDSSIRVCLDNLTRVSELTGSCFLVLHHAGKPKDGHASDPRTIARGSSAIFDACGTVFVVTAGKTPDAPRRISEVKTPADAEGGAIDDFGLIVEDVAAAASPTAGVRVMYGPLDAPNPVVQASSRYTAVLEQMMEVVRAHPGESQNIIVGHAGMGRSRGVQLLNVLEETGRVFVTDGPRKAKFYRPVDGVA